MKNLNKKHIITATFLLFAVIISIAIVHINQNDSDYLKMAEKYVNSQIPEVQTAQDSFIEAGIQQKNGGSNQSGLVIEKARIDNIAEAVVYKGYKAFHYKASYLPNDAGLVAEVGAWQVSDDGWLSDNRPLYLIFTDSNKPEFIGEMPCEFSSDGYSEGFYETFDLWLSEQK